METENIRPVFLDKHYLQLSGDLASVVRDVASLYTQYQQALLAHENQEKNFKYFKDNFLNYAQNIGHVFTRAAGLFNIGINTRDDQGLAVIMKHLQYHVGSGTDLKDRMVAHLESLQEPEQKPLPEGVLTIEHILEIFDGKHPNYVMIKNKIKDVTPSSMHYNYHQRLSFALKESDEDAEKYYVDYTTDYMPGDYEGRKYLDDQIQDGEFEDQTFEIKTKKVKK
jgi:hypothetical protein